MTNILFGVALLASLAACSSDRLRAIGGSCGTSSDCPSQQICEDSYCVFPCTVDADCPYNLVCDGRICAVERRVPGPTVPPPEPVPSCEGEPDGTACTQPSDESGYCFEGDCVECLVNDHCGGSAQCARAQCTDDHFCNVVTLHDGIGDGSAADAGWVSEPVLSPEYTLTNITTRMSDIAWDGQNFLVVFRAADSWFAARIAP
ncbi:MAG TPA: hypothetical protein VLC93_04100, partial [Myxococcota bacterium]|nr:hypothetical protein [Myxococcota bacterium]